jgi:recombination protein RecT
MATNLPAKAPEWRRDIEAMTTEFTRTLPPQVPTERFVRTILTAMQMEPKLSQADRHTLKVACMKAAQDGLLPDGRDGALVIYNTKVKEKDEKGRDVERWIPAVQWMPMVAGLLKKARNSGEIASVTGHVVYKHDKFRLVFGDDEILEHEPNLDVDEAELVEANAIGAYAIGKLKDGTIIRVWRSRGQIMKAKSQSKAAGSLMWTKFWEEGWIKTAIRYLTKYLPSSTDKDGVDTLARAAERDDEAYDFSKARDITPADEPRSKLDQFVGAKLAADEVNGHDSDTGEIDEDAEMAEPAKKRLMSVVTAGGEKLVTDSSTVSLLMAYRQEKAHSTDKAATAVANLELLRYLAGFASGQTLAGLQGEIEAAEVLSDRDEQGALV